MRDGYKGAVKWIGFFIFAAAGAAFALDVKDYDHAVNDRFISGFPDAPVLNKSPRFVGAAYDLSGVGWLATEPKHNFALITPKHFLYAKHWSPNPGDLIKFVNREGEVKGYSMAKQNTFENYDLAIGTLAEAIPARDHIAHYRVLYLGPSVGKYIGEKLLMYGHTARIGRNEIIQGLIIQSLHSEYNFQTLALKPGICKVESGDSGGPSFIDYKGELTLAGTHWMADSDSMVAGLITMINHVIAEDGYEMEVIDASK